MEKVPKVPWKTWEKMGKNQIQILDFFGKMVGNGKTDIYIYIYLFIYLFIYSKSNPEIGEVWRSLDMFCRCLVDVPFHLGGIQRWQRIHGLPSGNLLHSY